MNHYTNEIEYFIRLLLNINCTYIVQVLVCKLFPFLLFFRAYERAIFSIFVVRTFPKGPIKILSVDTCGGLKYSQLQQKCNFYGDFSKLENKFIRGGIATFVKFISNFLIF